MSWIVAARRIVANCQYEVLDPTTGEPVETEWAPGDPEGYEPVEELVARDGGVLLDLFSASVMVQIHDALNESNRERFASMPLPKAHDMAMKLMARTSKNV